MTGEPPLHHIQEGDDGVVYYSRVISERVSGALLAVMSCSNVDMLALLGDEDTDDGSGGGQPDINDISLLQGTDITPRQDNDADDDDIGDMGLGIGSVGRIVDDLDFSNIDPIDSAMVAALPSNPSSATTFNSPGRACFSSASSLPPASGLGPGSAIAASRSPALASTQTKILTPTQRLTPIPTPSPSSFNATSLECILDAASPSIK